MTNPDGHTWTYAYDGYGNQTSETDPDGDTTTATYNGFDEPLSVTNADGATTSYTYDPSGNLTSLTSPVDASRTATSTYAYDDSSQPSDVTAVTGPNGGVTHVAYDADGDVTSVSDPKGNETTYTYACASGCDNGIGWLYGSTSPRGGTTSYTLDQDGRITSKSDPLGNTTSYRFDGDGNTTAMTNPRGKTTRYAYDGDDERTSTTRPDGVTVTTGYDGDGNVTSQVSGLGEATAYVYDARDEVTSMTTPPTSDSPGGITTGYGYDPAGQLTSITQPGVGASILTTTEGYDSAGRLTSTGYSDHSTPNVTYTYDPVGRRTSMTDGTGTSHYSYNTAGWLTSTTDGAGDVVGYSYDLDGNPTAVTYPNGKTVERTYNGDDQLTGVTDWNDNTTSFSYDADGDLTSMVYPNGFSEAGSYRLDDTVSELSDATSKATLADYVYARDPDASLASATATGTAAGPSETYGYDDLGQLDQYPTAAPGGASGGYAYDADGDLTATPDGSTLTYDAADELTKFAGPGGGVTSYGYDQRGERSTETPSAGVASSYAYNEAGELTGYTRGTVTAQYAYDGDGLRTSKTVGGVASRFVYDQVTRSVPLVLDDGTNDYIYGPNDEAVEQVARPSQVSLVTTATAADTLGLQSSLSVTFSTQPKAGDQILLFVNESSGQDAQTPSGYTAVGTYAAPNAGETTVVYRRTAAGGETGATVAFNQGLNIHAKTLIAAVYRNVDPVNPVDATSSAGTQFGATTVTAPSITSTVDDGELVVVQDALNNLLATTWTAPSGMTNEATSSGTLVASAIADQPLPTAGPTGVRTATSSVLAQLEAVAVVLKASPTITYLQHDQLGSTRLLTNTGGGVVGTYSYTPYGATASHTGTSTPLEFNGQYLDPETGLYYLRARYYDPTTGSFLTRDPLEQQTMAPYNYAGADPLDESDPSGDHWCPHAICGNIGTILTGLAVGSCLGASAFDGELTAPVCIGGGAVALGGRAYQRHEDCRPWTEDIADAIITFGTAGFGSIAEAGLETWEPVEDIYKFVKGAIKLRIILPEIGIGSIDQYEQEQS